MTGPKLIWTRSGDGSHWEGCYGTHWDCAIAALRRAGTFAENMYGATIAEAVARSFGEAHERRAALA